MSFHSFTEEHACFSSVLRFAGELVQSPNPTINEFGTIVYKHLFYNLSSDRKTVLTYLSKHLGEVDSETTAALSVLQEIAVERIEILRNFVDDLKCKHWFLHCITVRFMRFFEQQKIILCNHLKHN